MSDDLVKRLRWKAGAYAKEAANRIEQLAATVEKLEEKNSRLKLDLLLANDVADAAIEGKKELEAKLATCEKYKAEFIRMDRIAGLLADSNDDLEAKLEKAVEALDGVMVGGNHLAVWLSDDHPPAEVEPLAALEKIGAGVSFDVWCCWRSIMLARTTLAELKGDTDAT